MQLFVCINDNEFGYAHSDQIESRPAEVEFHFPRQPRQDPRCNSPNDQAQVQQSAECSEPMQIKI